MSTDLARLAAATLLASFSGPDVPDWLRRRVDEGLGGVCLFGSNLRPARAPLAPGPPFARGTGSSADAGAAATPPPAGPGGGSVAPASAAGPGGGSVAPASAAGHGVGPATVSPAAGPHGGAAASSSAAGRGAGRTAASSAAGPGVAVAASAAGHGAAVRAGDGDAVFDAGVLAAARVSAALHAVRPSVLVALDEEGGDVTRIEAHIGSSVPGNAALGAVDDAALTRRLAHGLGLRLVEAGIDLDLAPCADANTDPANPVIGVRSFGADPALVARHVAAFVEGMQAAGVAACAKHFPGHGATAVDSHLDLPVVGAPAEVLRVRELVPFRAAIAAGASTVMLGHLRMPAFDDLPATISHRIATGLLRDELGFRGAVVTDALDMQGIGGPPDIPANVVRAVAAGADLCCLGSEGTDELIGACIDALVRAVHSGALDEARLAEAAGHVAAIHRGWLHTPKPVPPSLPDLGAEAARRALRVDGDLGDGLAGPAHVVELRNTPNIAAGVVPWGVAAPLADLIPGTTTEQLDPTAALAVPVGEVLARAQGRPLVVVFREGRRAGTARLVADLVAARPDAIVVDMGWPSEVEAEPTAPLEIDGGTGRAGVHVSTYGASRASGEAVARLLAGRDVPASPAAAAVPSAGRSPRG